MVMLSSTNLKLLNQPSKKFKSRFIGPYKVIKKISSQAYELSLPSSMKVHPVFHISLLKEFYSSPSNIPLVDNIPAANDLIHGDDHFHVQSLLDHKIAHHPSTYHKGPALLFLVHWENYDSSHDSWEPYISIKRTDAFEEYLKTSDKFRLLLLSSEYLKLSNAYPSRFPRALHKSVFTP